MNTLGFFGEVAVMSPHDRGHPPRMRSGGSGMRALSQILSNESLSYSLKHFSTGEHSLHISWRSTHRLHLYFMFSWWCHQMETCSASLVFVRGIHRWLRGIHRSPVYSPHTDQWRGALMCLICWTNGWVNNQDAGDLRRHRALYDVTVMWCRIVIQWSSSRGIFRRSTRHSCPILDWWNGTNWGVPCIMEGMASNLAHCSIPITISWN